MTQMKPSACCAQGLVDGNTMLQSGYVSCPLATPLPSSCCQGRPLMEHIVDALLHRSINMMDETYLVEHIKEQVCFVSTHLGADLAAAKSGRHRLEYVLPDGVNEQLGYARPPAPKAEKKDRDAAAREQV